MRCEPLDKLTDRGIMTIVSECSHLIMFMTQRQQQKEATAQRIFEAALKLFTTQGYEATTIESITNAAGVAKGTFFVHFPSKEAVLGHLSMLQLQRLRMLVEETPGFTELDLFTQCATMFRTLAAGVEGQRELVQQVALTSMMQGQILRPESQGVDVFDEILTNLAQRAQERGQLRPDTQPSDIAHLLRTTYFVTMLSWLQQNNEPFETLLLRYLKLIFEGIAATT